MFRDDERVSVAAVVIRRLLQVASPRGSPFKSDGVVSREHLSGSVDLRVLHCKQVTPCGFQAVVRFFGAVPL